MRVETSSILDLPGTHKMGHTCANLNGELFFIWGGSDENDDSQVSNRRDNQLWIYETLTGYWRNRSCSGECPPRLSGTTSTLINRRMYVFGGHSTSCDNWLNSLYCLDLETFIWKDLGSHADAEPTKPIPSDKCVSWSYEGQMYVFGGYGWSQTEHLLELLDRQKDLQLTPDYRWPKFGWNNQLVEYNTRTNKWLWPSYSGKCPSARAAHSGALMGNKYYLFGGRDSRERLNDLYSFDMLTFQWTQITNFSDPSNTQLERPIRHLLEHLIYDEDNLNQAQALNSELSNEAQEINMEDEDADLVDQVLIREEEELFNPSPSSSNPLPDNSAAVSAADFDLDEDEAEFQFNYAHPSHLLERWSLSSHQSASSDISSTQVNCLYDLPPSYEQQSESTDHTQVPNHLLCLRDDQNHLTFTLSQPSTDQEQQTDQESSDESAQPLQQPHHVPNTQASNEDATIIEILPYPVGRSFSSFTPVSSEDIILYGGISSQDENLADCWMFNISNNNWTQLDLKIKHTRLWHTASRTKNNELIIIGGSCSNKVDEFCSDVLTMSMEPKSLKKLSLDTVARSIRMRSIHRIKNLPSTIGKLIKLRKQAMALTMRRYHRQVPH